MGCTSLLKPSFMSTFRIKGLKVLKFKTKHTIIFSSSVQAHWLSQFILTYHRVKKTFILILSIPLITFGPPPHYLGIVFLFNLTKFSYWKNINRRTFFKTSFQLQSKSKFFTRLYCLSSLISKLLMIPFFFSSNLTQIKGNWA